jgi:hypothetical protein
LTGTEPRGSRRYDDLGVNEIPPDAEEIEMDVELLAVREPTAK